MCVSLQQFGIACRLNLQATRHKDIKVYDAGARCQLDPELPGEKTSIKIVQLVESRELIGFKFRITLHRKSYYCGLFTYSKSILLVYIVQGYLSVKKCLPREHKLNAWFSGLQILNGYIYLHYIDEETCYLCHFYR